MDFGYLDTQTTSGNGMAVFGNGDPWIIDDDELLYVLVETDVPPNYSLANKYTFFTLNPAIATSDISDLNALLAPELNTGQSVNQVSDFISIINTFDGIPGSLRVHKTFSGLTDAQILFYLSNNFQIIISNENGVQLGTYDLSKALDPLGIILEDVDAGTYYITEQNANVSGFSLTTTPPMPIQVDVAVEDSVREVLVRVDNNYSRPVPPPPPGNGPGGPGGPGAPPGGPGDSGVSGGGPGGSGTETGDAFELSLYIFLFVVSLACIGLFAGRMISVRSSLRKR